MSSPVNNGYVNPNEPARGVFTHQGVQNNQNRQQPLQQTGFIYDNSGRPIPVTYVQRRDGQPVQQFHPYAHNNTATIQGHVVPGTRQNGQNPALHNPHQRRN